MASVLGEQWVSNATWDETITSINRDDYMSSVVICNCYNSDTIYNLVGSEIFCSK
ncbi:MAG TPA: hypothetical protein PKU76_00760 [Candidatus Cloacimonas sp.]|jgi:hypothetical protein|nr:hypothetical protein [Candidatus Cloacimonas sp.]